MKKLSFFKIFLFSFLIIFSANVKIFSQEEIEEDDVIREIYEFEYAEAEDDGQEFREIVRQELTPEQNMINMDIMTSSLSELAFWCRALGLSEAGTSDDLARRLREHFEISDYSPQILQDNRKIITIESARNTEYFTIEAIDEDYARLSGEVRISLKDGDAIHEISAWNILFNRTRNIITASGGVEYRKTEGDTIEVFRGETITVDIDNWSSIFLGGVSERAIQNEDTTYVFAGTVISRDDQDVTILSKATIKNAKDEESLWSISASRVWLLPGSDFAILNAVLKVGEIPLIYIPFFYFPSDKVIFHPVIGSRTREGNYVQTTTYILGRPTSAPATNSSLSRIMGSSNDMEKKREGLFLRSTGKKQTDPGTTSLVMMLDYYANLGAYLGFDLKLPGRKIFGPLDLSLGLGFTQTIALVGNNYTPYFPNYDGGVDWNWSSFLFFNRVPFRYRFKAGNTITGKAGSFTWNIPYYSDPYVDTDFLNRAEDMDWVNMIQQGGSALEAEISSTTELTQYTWTFSGTIKQNFPNMSPYINSLSIGSLSSALNFKSYNDSEWGNYNQSQDIEWYRPSRKFYAPETWQIISLSLTIGGAPLNIGGAPARTVARNTVEYDDVLKNIGVPRSPFEKPEEEDEEEKKDPIDELVPPVLSQTFSAAQIGNSKLTWDYSILPSMSSTLRFNHQNWNNYSEVDWSDANSIVTNVRGNARTGISFNHSLNFFQNSLIFAGSGAYGHYHNINEDDQDKEDAARYNEERGTFFTTTYELKSSIRPFIRNPMLSQTSLQYSLTGDAIKSVFKGDSATFDPKWDIEYGEWKKEKINVHNLNTNISLSILDKTQNLQFQADLPPRDPLLRWSARFNFWISSTSISQNMSKKEDEEDWTFDLLRFTETLTFPIGAFTQNINFDVEEDKPVRSLSSTLRLQNFNASFQMNRMRGSEWRLGDDGEFDWYDRPEDEEELRPDYLNFSYNHRFSFSNLFKNRMTLSINLDTSLDFKLQKYTDSEFTFGLGFVLSINKFLDLTLSTRSVNSSVYNYVRNIYPFNSANIQLEGVETNLFKDLFNSFRFDDRQLRERSGFKMKNFMVNLTHYLGDWTASLSWTMAPWRKDSRSKFEMNNEISFSLKWTPIDFIKSDINYDASRDPNWVIE